MKKEDQKSSDSQKKGINRRGFLKGMGLTTAGTVLLGSDLLAFQAQDTFKKGNKIGIEGAEITLRINGTTRDLWVEPRTTLTTALREILDLTGTKLVCDRGSCSACTVFLDGKPVNACMTLAVDVGDREVTTIEGIAKGDELHPVQEAFIEHDASQCGYCTPGMVMSLVHLLENNPNPTLDDVKHSVRGNLCRCGTHPHVFKAGMASAKKYGIN